MLTSLPRLHASPSNHPVIKEDGLLAIFLTEPSLEAWRKHTSISLEEESASKRVDRVEEMSIPSDLEEKLTYVPEYCLPVRHSFELICHFQAYQRQSFPTH